MSKSRSKGEVDGEVEEGGRDKRTNEQTIIDE